MSCNGNMELRIKPHDQNISYIALIGRLDLPGVQQIELKFTANTVTQRKPTLVDLSELEYIASLGLRMFITAAKALHLHGLRLVLLRPQPQVEEVFRAAGFDQLIPVEHIEEQALKHFNP